MNSNRGLLVFLGIFVAIPGIVFTLLMARSANRAFKMDQWIATPCQIRICQIQTRTLNQTAPEYSLNLQYSFTYNQESHLSSQFELRGKKWTKDPEKISKLTQKFPSGHEATCYINPNNVNQSVLKKDSKAPLYSIWFPILFVVGGLGMAISPFIKTKPNTN